MIATEYVKNNTICALAGSSSRSALSVIRVSGPLAHQMVGKIFRPAGAPLSGLTPRRVYFGRIYDGLRLIDEVLVHIAVAPVSFTGEDTAEISCHGSVYIQQTILALLVSQGARLAGAGEFTQRAFLNGKMDLAQAEAVADLIAAESAAAHRVALQQLRGGFSDELKHLREQLLHFVSLMELELDFAEEEVEFADRTQFNALLDELQSVTARLLQSFSLGNAIKNGVPVAIVGQTNVGKSTLLNALLGEERAIVSDIHGTTRDAIEDCMQLNGVMFRFIDTAGIRHTNETIEQLGIERTYDKIKKAAIVLLLIDATRPETLASVDDMKARLNEGQQLIVAVNKVDCQTSRHVEPVETSHANGERFLDFARNDEFISLSAKNKQGLDALIDALGNAVNLGNVSPDETVVTNVRHYEALQGTQEALQRVKKGFAAHLSGELIAQDIREALYHLGSITGEISTDDILNSIFGKFCIGK